jgi:hypothetical protein
MAAAASATGTADAEVGDEPAAGGVIEDLEIHAALLLDVAESPGNGAAEDQPVPRATAVQLVISPETEGAAPFRILSRAPESDAGDAASAWRLHAAGRLTRHAVDITAAPAAPAPSAANPAAQSAPESPETIRARCTEAVDVAAFYQGLAARGLPFGPAFRGVGRLWRRDGEALVEIPLPNPAPESGPATGAPWATGLHPALLDAAFQALAAAVPGYDPADAAAPIYMPVALDRFEWSGAPLDPGGAMIYSQATIEPAGPAAAPADQTAAASLLLGHVRVMDAAGRLIARATGMRMKRARAGDIEPAMLDGRVDEDAAKDQFADWLYEVQWQPAALEPTAAPPQPPAPSPAAALAAPERLAAELAGWWSGELARGATALYDELDPELDALVPT